MSINFHIGASEGDINWSGTVPYDTWPGDVKISLGGAAIFLQLRVVRLILGTSRQGEKERQCGDGSGVESGTEEGTRAGHLWSFEGAE